MNKAQSLSLSNKNGETMVSPFLLRLINCFLILVLVSCASTNKISKEPNVEAFPEFPEANVFYQNALDYEADEAWAQAADQLDSALTTLSKGGMRRDSLGVRRVLFHQVLLEEYEIVFEQLGQYEPVNTETTELPWEADTLGIDSTAEQNTPELIKDIDFSQFEMNIEVNDRVLEEIYYLAYRAPSFVASSLGRIGLYDSLIDAEIALAKVPKELKYLALVESGYKTTATSSAKAAGIWQFIPSTAKHFGMNVSWWIDERRSPAKATRSAFKYLNRLYEEFGDWYLAMAAYNCGEGRIRRQIKKQETKNYWELELPTETRKYVPRILAAIIIASNPQKYKLEFESQKAVPVDTVRVEHCMEFDNISHILSVEKDDLRLLNPELRQNSTPPSQSFNLALPLGKGELFAKYYEQLDKSKLRCQEGHRVRSGENLGVIARKYGVSVSAIKSANNMRNSKIWPNQILFIPIQGGLRTVAVATNSETKTQSSSENDTEKPVVQKSSQKIEEDSKKDLGKLSYYRVIPGDNLYSISKRLGVSVQDLLDWNNLQGSAPLKIGQKLEVFGSKKADSNEPNKLGRKKVYRVQSGDNLYQISRHLGVSLNDLLKWNGIEGRAVIKKGDLLEYYNGNEISKPDSDYTSLKKNETYVVKDGDSLWGISQKFGISVETLVQLNKLKSNSISPGQKLKVK